MKKIIATAAGIGIALAYSTVAMAAGTAAIETGFAAAGGDLVTLIQGAGGWLITIIAAVIAIWAWTSGKGMVPVASAFGVALAVNYGLDTLTGISGATATTALLGF